MTLSAPQKRGRPRRLRLLPRLLLIAMLMLGGNPASPLVGPTSAFAQKSSSGGYSRPASRPSSSGSTSGSAGTRRPSVSDGGGYSRPSSSGSSGNAYTPSASDRALSRQSSGQTLQDYQTPRPAPPPPYAAPSQPSGGSMWGSTPSRRPAPNDYGTAGQGSYNGGGFQGGVIPPYAAPQQRFGAFEAAMLFGMLNSLSNSGSREFFRQNQNDPGYLQWRQSIDQAARTDPNLAGRLSELDSQLGKPQPPGRTPPPAQAASTGGSGMVALIIFLAIGALLLLWLARRRTARAASTPSANAPPGLKGSATTRFRVGMTMPMDPTPFILAATSTKVTAPSGGGMISVEAVGLVQDGGVALHRLYVPGRQGFFQLHLDAGGQPDECRYFSQIDEVAPATQDEWGFWLDPAQGMIGWPEFQTKDGKIYGRVWAAGSTKVPPRQQSETIEDLKGVTTRTLQSMLYAAQTGAPAPAPPTEYILVTAVQAGGQAWVEIHAGLDISPSALTLPAVALN